MSSNRLPQMLTLLVASLLIAATTTASAQTRLKNICRVKGQEENTLQGIGLVVGLDKSGDSAASKSTIHALAAAMQFMGSPVPADAIKEAKNVAIVMVQATIPAAGARQGDQIDCVVSSIGDASSLAGGKLISTPLLGPRTTGDRVFAFAVGAVSVDNPLVATGGKVVNGCRLEEDFHNAFHKDGKITLVLDKNKADFQVAQAVAQRLNSQLTVGNAVTEQQLARAIDQVNIEVTIPDAYLNDPVSFVSDIMEQPILEPDTEARVVINRSSGTVIVTGDTTIGAAIVTHKNISVETGGGDVGQRFFGVEAPERSSAKLKALVSALEAVQVEAEDIADILLGLSRSGKLHARVILE